LLYDIESEDNKQTKKREKNVKYQSQENGKRRRVRQKDREDEQQKKSVSLRGN
jgi:hypothetical protein